MMENKTDGTAVVAPDPELVQRAVRRRFSAKYKLEILQKTDRLERPGEIGELCAVRACTRRT
jgi:hypothetical protein